jgi:hypothetical protein
MKRRNSFTARRPDQKCYLYFLASLLKMSQEFAKNLTSPKKNITEEHLHKCLFEVKVYFTIKD